MPAITVNKNLHALLQNHNSGKGRKPIICLEGSSRSGKTWAWLEFVINASVLMPGIVSSAFRHDATTHDKAAVRDFLQIMMEKYPEYWNGGSWNKQTKVFTFANGSVLEFCGTNDPGKLHGPERDIAILNEVMEIRYEAYRQISARTRLMVIIDWNPSLNKHWVFDRVMTRDDVLYVHSTYKDNPHLSAKQVQEIEGTNPDIPDNVRQGTADQWFWDVYGLGKRGRREGAIFKDYIITDDWPARINFQRWGFGLDFGFSEDPAALIECGLYQSRLWVKEWIYDTGLLTCISHAKPNIPSIHGIMAENGFQKDWNVCADCSRPDNIAELVAEGYNVYGVPKGKDSIVAGLNLMQRFPIMVHRNSVNIQEELQQYSWKRHADGSWLDVPEDKWNHSIDAIRYWAMHELPMMSFQRSPSRPRVARKLRRY